MLGLPRCLGFGGTRIDAAIAEEIVRVVEPVAIEAALEAERMHHQRQNERRSILELDLQQGQYDAALAERRYAACDPDNRLIAAQLEKNWEAALRRVEECRARLPETSSSDRSIQPPDFSGLADDLVRVWNAPGVTTRTRQQILRTLIADIIADVDDTNREVVLTIHWKGGQHSVLRVRKPKTGEHGCQTPDQAIAVMKQMATRYSDDDIATTLNRMGIRTGQNKTWNGHRVSFIRRVQGSHAFRPAEKDGQWLTMKEAAKCLNVTSHVIRRLIVDRVLPAEQVVPGAPWQIEACQIQSEDGIKAIHKTKGPYRRDTQEQISVFPNT
ncbi:hypothetical protein I6F15_31425 [Bradyrhizobium sp. BRP14]|nr:hypothetical protein [Bradyrhizobium sp. BRP14]